MKEFIKSEYFPFGIGVLYVLLVGFVFSAMVPQWLSILAVFATLIAIFYMVRKHGFEAYFDGEVIANKWSNLWLGTLLLTYWAGKSEWDWFTIIMLSVSAFVAFAGSFVVAADYQKSLNEEG